MNDAPSGRLWQGCHHVPLMLSASCSLLRLFSTKEDLNLYPYLSLYMKHVPEGHRVLCVSINFKIKCVYFLRVDSASSSHRYDNPTAAEQHIQQPVLDLPVWHQRLCCWLPFGVHRYEERCPVSLLVTFSPLSLCFHVSICHLSSAASEW